VRQRRHIGNADALDVEIPVTEQERFNAYVLKQIGFRTDAGRLDTSTHPFSTGIGPGDTRVTTRFQSDQFVDALGSTMHEAGHAMYEQGIPRERRFGQPLAEAVSLGIHESQSRLWENHVGRSAAFWRWAADEARRFFAPVLDGIAPESFFPAVNTIKPHPIRVESDELTYNLHIMLRFDLERAMVRGDLSVRDLPAAWNDRMRSDLGLEIEHDAQGCLQDIHWSMGAIGYFPTYTLGNLYGAQFWQTLQHEHGEVDREMSHGRFDVVLDWLRERIHAHGRRFPAPELCRRVTGHDLDPGALIEHLSTKVDAIYPQVGAASS
jgi:carboxypeptidase Taq